MARLLPGALLAVLPAVLQAVLLAVLLAFAGGCSTPSPAGSGAGDENVGGTPASSLAPEAAGQVRVLASDSLAEAFDLIKEDFQARNPRVEVLLSYGESNKLAQQIAGGESVDVLATDDPDVIREVTVFGQPQSFGGAQLNVAALNDSANAGVFVEYLREGSAQRVLSDTGLLRP